MTSTLTYGSQHYSCEKPRGQVRRSETHPTGHERPRGQRSRCDGGRDKGEMVEAAGIEPASTGATAESLQA